MPKHVGKCRKREKIKIIVSFRFIPTRRRRENSRKIAKKLNKLKNTVMASFQAKTGWKRLKIKENKKFSFRFVPTRGIRDNSKKIVKNFKK